MRIPYISILAAGALALGGCAYGDMGLGLGFGSGYSDFGYGYPYGPYGGYGTYPGYYGGFGYGMPYGWYDDYYYPGSGLYVYDSYRRPHLMTSTQRSYWASRERVTTSGTRENWSAFDRSQARAERQAAREQRRIERQEQRDNPRL